jgi:hypothetical protein
MRCDCPNHYSGRLCQVPKEQCRVSNDGNDDDSIVCFHGGICVSTIVEDGFGNQDTELSIIAIVRRSVPITRIGGGTVLSIRSE